VSEAQREKEKKTDREEENHFKKVIERKQQKER
jgi:hypothetical protein